jgi:hypothetical protein
MADLVTALFQAGRMEDAFAYASDAVARAAAAGDRSAELCARTEQEGLRTYLEPEGAVEQLAATIGEALPVFQAAGDEFGLVIAYSGLVQVENMQPGEHVGHRRAAVQTRRGPVPLQEKRYRVVSIPDCLSSDSTLAHAAVVSSVLAVERRTPWGSYACARPYSHWP